MPTIPLHFEMKMTTTYEHEYDKPTIHVNMTKALNALAAARGNAENKHKQVMDMQKTPVFVGTVEMYKAMLEDEASSDLEIRCEGGEVVTAHTLILGASSEYVESERSERGRLAERQGAIFV